MQLRCTSVAYKWLALVVTVGWSLRLAWAIAPVVTGDYWKAIEAFIEFELGEAKGLSSEEEREIRDRIGAEMRGRLLAVLGWGLSGLLLSILSLRMNRPAIAIATSSVLFLAGWLLQPAFLNVGLIDGLTLKVRTISTASQLFTFAVFDVIMPTSFLTVLALLALFLLSSRFRRP